MDFETLSLRYPIRKAPNGCWVWTGQTTKDGYGYVRRGPKLIFAHRMVYTQLHGPIQRGARIDHLCRNRACVNPEHLEPVTHQENTVRGEGPTALNAKKSHCKRGHPFNEENTIYRKDGSRRCRICWGPKAEQAGQVE